MNFGLINGLFMFLLSWMFFENTPPDVHVENEKSDSFFQEAQQTGSSMRGQASYWVAEICNNGADAFEDVAFCPPPPLSVSVRVNASTDDAEQNLSTGAVVTNSTDLELAVDGTASQLVGMRFNGITIPQGATITSAYVEFETDVAWSGACSLTLQGQAADNPGTFTTTASNLSSRTKTMASVAWSPSAWSAVDGKHQTPSLVSIVQEIVNRAGWASGNSMVMFASGTGTREAESWDGEATAAPLLVVEYTTVVNEICNNGLDDDGDGFIDFMDDLCNGCADLLAGDTIFYADFENTSGNNAWTFTNSATDGNFIIGVPLPYQTTISATTQMEIAAFKGTQTLLTGNGDIQDLDGGPATASSPDICLPSGFDCLNLSFQYYFANAENGDSPDYAIIEVRDAANGAVLETIVSVNGQPASIDAVWTPVSLNIGAHAGKSIYIHVRAADLGTGSKTEVALDEVIIHLCGEICDNSLDDDGDGLTDCADPDCGFSLGATFTNVTCAGNDGTVNLSVTGGTAPFSFNWSNSAASEDLTGIPAATYSVTVTSGTGCTAATSVTLPGLINFDNSGSISGDETLCGTYNPALITSMGVPSGGNGSNTYYQWQQSIDGGTTWTDIAGATSATFDPASISQTTLYRRGARQFTCLSWIYSNTVAKTVVVNETNGGTIGGNESFCGGFDPALVTSLAPSGGGNNGTLQYQWQQSTNGGTTWTDISGTTADTYDPPAITQTTQYRRGARRNPCSAWVYSNIVIKSVVVSYIDGGTIGSDEGDCENFDPALMTTVTAPSGGIDGTPMYQWEKRESDGAGGWLLWVNIGGATAESYDPGIVTLTTQYRRRVQRSPCTSWKYSNTVTKSVYQNVTNPGSITGTESHCGTFDPGNINTGAGASGATGGVLEYRWQQRTATSSWTVIAGETGPSYNPPAIAETMYYRRQAKSTACSNWLSSNEVAKFVVSNYTDGGTITGNESSCGGFYDPDIILPGTPPSGGAFGTPEYRWEFRVGNAQGQWTAWQQVFGATGATYDPPLVLFNTEYRRLTRRSPCTGWLYSNAVLKSITGGAVANPDTFTTCPAVPFTSFVILNDVTPSSPKYKILSLPSNGTLSMDTLTGQFTYTPASSACGTDEFTYRVCNLAETCCDTASVYLIVGDNTPPQIQNVPPDITITCADIPPDPDQVFGYDSCPAIFIDFTETTTQEDAQGCGNYTIIRTWEVRDLCDNVAIDSQRITVEDVEAPEIFRVYTLGNGKKLVAGISRNNTQHWKTVRFPFTFPAQPIVFSQVITTNEPSAAVTRHRDVTNTKFELRLQEEEGADSLHLAESVAWLAIEPGALGSGALKYEMNTVASVTDAWKLISFANAYGSDPVFIAAAQTTNENDPVAIRFQNLTPGNVQVFLEEETSSDAEKAHAAEKLGYLALTNGAMITDSKDRAFGESGTLTVDENWVTVSLSRKYNKPVVILGGVDYKNTDETIIQVKNVTSGSFDVHLKEWDYLGGGHPKEDICYLVVEGAVPTDVGNYCANAGEDLVPGLDLIAKDNCDDIVTLDVNEVSAWTGHGLGIVRTWSAVDNCGNLEQFAKFDTCTTAALRVKALLSGAYPVNGGGVLMRDDLRVKSYIPHEEPYSSLDGFPDVTANAAQPEVTGVNGWGPQVVCHKPGTAAQKERTVSATALAAHLAHGDILRGCGGSGQTPSIVPVDYQTIADGPWSGSATWKDGLIPPVGDVVGKNIRVEHHISVSGSNLKFKSNANLIVVNGSLTLSGGNLQIEDAQVIFDHADLALSGGDLQLTQSKSRLEVFSGTIGIAQDFQNSGGVCWLENACLSVGESFQNAGGKDTLFNVCADIGQGIANSFNGKIYAVDSRLAIHQGSFDNSLGCKVQGNSLVVWVQNGNLVNEGTWTASVHHYCVSGMVTMPSGVLPNLETCTDIAGFFNPCQCEPGSGFSDETVLNYNRTGKIDTTLLHVTGPKAIVDWVLVELRDTSNESEPLDYATVMLLRDGRVVTESGDSIITFPERVEGDYLVTVRHRNHHGLMTDVPFYLSSTAPPLIDFSSQSLPVRGGTLAGRNIGNKRLMWAGDFNEDGKIIYQGPDTDAFDLFARVLIDDGNAAFLANYVVNGYELTDINLDGKTIFQGPDNDLWPLLSFSILSHPGNPTFLANFVVHQLLP